MVDDVTVLAQDMPGADDAQIRKLLGRRGRGTMRVKPDAVVLGAVGLASGWSAWLPLREATLSTHGPVDPGSGVELVVSARTEGAEQGQTLARWSRRCC